MSAFLDFAPASFDVGVTYWSAITGYPVSAARGAEAEFATLIPPSGDEYLRVQRLGHGPSRIHLDLHVLDPQAAARRAVSLGATVMQPEVEDLMDYVVLRSPAGITHCFVGHRGAIRPQPMTWPTGQHSMIYQLSLDIPAADYDVESDYWARLLAARRQVLQQRPEFSWLRGASQFALDLLLQRLDREDGVAGIHVDLGTNDRDLEVARHRALGAELVAVEDFWTVLRDPSGMTYCVTSRDPATGRLAAAVE